MNRRSLLKFGAGAVALLWASRVAATPTDGWDPLEASSQIVTWFSSLNQRFDTLVRQETRAQLLRSVGRLRQCLHLIEVRSTLLRELIPPAAPDPRTRRDLSERTISLQALVRELGRYIEQFGSDIQLQDEANRVGASLFAGLRTRSRTLYFVDTELSRAGTRPWPATELRAQLTVGITAIHNALGAVIAFERRLAALRST